VNCPSKIYHALIVVEGCIHMSKKYIAIMVIVYSRLYGNVIDVEVGGDA
jgi:hypothetical protein